MSCFNEPAVLFLRNLTGESHCLITYACAVFPVFPEFCPYISGVQAENSAPFQAVELFNVARCDQDVVGILVAYQDFAVAVKNQASGRMPGLIEQGIVLCADLETVVQQL